MALYGRRKAWPHVLHHPASAELTAQTVPSTVSADDLARMRSQIVGRVVVPGDRDYALDRLGNPLYPAFPRVIVYCKVFYDVRVALRWARELDLTVTCRAGGHSTAGFSVNDGMVVDVSLINYVSIDPELMQARVGSGTQFAQVDAAFEVASLHAPTGGCGDVAIGGFLQGGGYGFTSRQYGMGCDNIIAAKVMLADGRIVNASADENPDLLWGICGGTGNNFGVVLEFTYQLVPMKSLWGFCLAWSAADAPAAMLLLQNGYTKAGAQPELGWQAAMAMVETKPTLLMMGLFNGARADGLAALDPILRVGTPQLIRDRSASYNQLNGWLIDSCLRFPDPPNGQTVFELKGVGYVDKPLDLSDWSCIVDFYLRSPNPFNILVMEAYGGQINAAPSGKNAFIHREVYMDVFVDSFWWDPNLKPAAVAWRDEFQLRMEPNFNGHRYQNYPERGAKNYRWMYWGDAFPTLLFLKNKYDPMGFFRFEQDISPYPDCDGITRSEAPSRFSDMTICGGPE
jgi:hypothetical protein